MSYQMTNLPFQPMMSEQPIQVVPLQGFFDDSSFEAHRHSFHMICWATRGLGLHYINFIEYEICRGRIFYLQENQVHQVRSYPPEGWMILFDKMLYHQFLQSHPEHEQTGFFDYFNHLPWVALNSEDLDRFERLTRLLTEEKDKANPYPACFHYLSLLLLIAADSYKSKYQHHINSGDAQVLRKLKSLIGEHFKDQRETGFYSNYLGVPARKLNEIVKKAMGKLVPDLLAERLLAETEGILAATDLPIKEIAFELGFNDQSHLSTFFKKHNGLAPSAFREKFRNARS
jgi:AraC family transcriptional activator of pobA